MSSDPRLTEAWLRFKEDVQYIVPKIDRGSFYRGYEMGIRRAIDDANEAKLTTKIKRFLGRLFS